MSAVIDRGVGKTTVTVTSDQVSQASAVDLAALRAAVPAELAGVLIEVLRIVAAGGTVTVGSMPDELTTTAAADLLGMSRPTLMKLIRDEQIVAHKVGTHTRLNTSDVLAYRDRLREQQRAALWELREFEQAEDLDY
ncbi:MULTISPECIES: helix-turn-helix domain-containing protein [Gordonia]|uniref:Helix-turn-helix domain-containing protein n=2 Tax=Gordonia TaxID=2053 RepID=L7LLU2_9ACTN|nr:MULTISPECIES: helix-turn-helix domain-containing protein [Gordonia]AUH67367.1 DNA-binding protein [Gordonia sp. YC-JH1]KJR06465.1 DNA-binding protein [Gordonia sihwensis]KXT55819.1 DNA-binding protein [Gordonia sp. QH-12]MBY4570418.1 DNA-binding protein [Gordonia sihwensis]WFN93003.1 helix-turn-helix domain-containing protein [Gordonia sihwensis]